MDQKPVRIRAKRRHCQDPLLDAKRRELIHVLQAVVRIHAKPIGSSRLIKASRYRHEPSRVAKRSRLVITPAACENTSPLQPEMPSLTVVFPIILLMAAIVSGVTFAAVHPVVGFLMIPFVIGIGWDSKMLTSTARFIFTAAFALILVAVLYPTITWQFRYTDPTQDTVFVWWTRVIPSIMSPFASFYFGRFVAHKCRLSCRVYTREEVLRSGGLDPKNPY